MLCQICFTNNQRALTILWNTNTNLCTASTAADSNLYCDCRFFSWVKRSARASPNDRRYSGLIVSSRAYIVSKYRDNSASAIVSNWRPTIYNRQVRVMRFTINTLVGIYYMY